MKDKLRKVSKTRMTKAKGVELFSARQDEDEEEMSTFPSMNPFEILSALGQKDQQLLEERGILIINDMISKQSLAKATQRLLILHFDPDFTDTIQIVLNSPGGYCDAGWAFIDLMSFVKNPIKTIAMGEICSMATSIFIAGDERVMSPNCSVMIHQFSTYGQGTYADLLATTKAWELEMEKDLELLIRCSKYTSKEQVTKHLLKETDHWLSAKEMKKHGLCDKIFVPRPRGKK